jgi:CheY-like chemotaxis protein
VIRELRAIPAYRSIPIIVLTAKDLTVAERQRLNGSVEQILQKGTYSRDDLLHEIHDRVLAPMQQRGGWILEETNG